MLSEKKTIIHALFYFNNEFPFMSLSRFSKLSIATLIFSSFSASATIVEVTTSHGNFKINLHDEATPITVTNFLKYVNDDDYDNTVVHRLVPNFVMQSGGFKYEGTRALSAIPTDSAIKNEPVYSNVRGTIAMAKIGGNVNSATSQWFINLSNNSGGSASLDTQNGGFTVFGEVIEGMEKVDLIAGLPLCSSVPMPNFTAEQCSDASFVPGADNFVTIVSVDIIDPTINSADSLSPVKNTSLPTTSPEPPKSSSGGGSLAWFSLAFMTLVSIRRFFKK